MKRHGLLFLFLIALLLAQTPPATASVITFDSLASFTTAVGPTTVETFQEARVAAGGALVMTGPLSSTTSNAIFQPGEILFGLSITDTPGPDLNGLVVIGDGLITGATAAVGSNSFTDVLTLLFDPGVQAVGFDFFFARTPGIPAPGVTGVITVFDAANNQLFRSESLYSQIGFFGVSSDVPIARLTVDGVRITATGSFPQVEFVDNIRTPVPEPASLTLLGLGLAGLCARRWRRKH